VNWYPNCSPKDSQLHEEVKGKKWCFTIITCPQNILLYTQLQSIWFAKQFAL